jgi:hypothetical protein
MAVLQGLRRFSLKLDDDIWVLIHIEVQSQSQPSFAERMFVYYYRLRDRFNRPVVSFAILSDDSAQWRPNSFTEALWGCRNHRAAKNIGRPLQHGCLHPALQRFGEDGLKQSMG